MIRPLPESVKTRAVGFGLSALGFSRTVQGHMDHGSRLEGAGHKAQAFALPARTAQPRTAHIVLRTPRLAR